MKKVILNALPPARLDTPSAALSILKAFLVHHGIETELIYWNILLEGLLPAFPRNTDTIHFELLPYCYLIAEEFGDSIAQSKANAYIKSKLPYRDILNDNSDYLAGVKPAFDDAVSRALSSFSNDTSLLFGIPCKYEQWIPGMVLGRSIKKLFPSSKIVIGGLRNRERAESIMKLGGHFDFAVWGEGEYPLLELARLFDAPSADLGQVPRLVFRDGGFLNCSSTDKGPFYDLNSRIFPDYSDYFPYLEQGGRKGQPVILPLESSRGCTWKACRFCVYGEGFETRKKEPSVLKEEIEHLLERYGTRYFAFMDNDLVANDHQRFNTILDHLTSIRRNREMHFIAEIIHQGFTTQTMEKFPRAGLERIHFGYESLSDNLLTQMKKRTTFSDNIFWVKFARKFGIKLPSANIIGGIIGEKDIDILESIDHLHFLRFYFDRDLFCHHLIPLRVAGHSDFYNMIPKEQLLKWDENAVFQLLPLEMVRDIDRFNLFDFSAKPNPLWEIFSKINDFYYDHLYSYDLSRKDGCLVYREFFNQELVQELAFSDLAHLILQETNSRITDFQGLLAVLAGKAPETDERKVCSLLDRLREKHLLYFKGDYQSIISVIDTDRVF